MTRKIVFITQEDPFYVRIFFEAFLAQYPRLSDIAGVFIAPSMGNRSMWRLIKQMYDFYGFHTFVRMGIRYAYYRLAARLPRKTGARRFFSIAQACRAYGVVVEHLPDINAPAFIDRLHALGPDLIVSVAAPQIFKAALVRLPRLGCINIHNSKLPRYRGMLPNFWQLYHGERTIGTTIHRVNETIDGGAILLQKETPVAWDETLESLICRTKRQGAAFMIEAIEGMFAGTLVEIANDVAAGSYYKFPTKQDVREFRRRGLRLV